MQTQGIQTTPSKNPIYRKRSQKSKLSKKPPSFTEEQLITQLRDLAEELGRTPREEDFNKSRKTVSVATITKKFGHWNAFVEAAGLKINKGYDISEKQLLREVKLLAHNLGRTPKAKEFDDSPITSSLSTAIKRFGTWSAFLEKAGLKLNKAPVISNQELFRQFKALAKELGRPPTKAEFINRPDAVSHSLIRRRFGSWNNFTRRVNFRLK